jgi:hypothetical protein
MVCSVKVGTVVKLEDCIYISLVCRERKVAEFCISEEEYKVLGKPRPGDVVDYAASSERKIEIRFLGRPVRV